MSETAPKHLYEIYIRTTPEKLWAALTDGKLTQKYFFGTTVTSTWKAGAGIAYHGEKDVLMVDGKILEVDAPRKLVTTWRAAFDPDMAKERLSRVTWTITPMGAICKLTVLHDDFDGENKTYASTANGWPIVLSGLKTVLETGEPLPLPPM